MSLRVLAFVAVLAAPVGATAMELPIPVVAAESFYGEVATAIGGDRVTVENVAISPDADPHDFAPPPSVARAVSDARVVIMNGLDYDHWMEGLLEASPLALSSAQKTAATRTSGTTRARSPPSPAHSPPPWRRRTRTAPRNTKVGSMTTRILLMS
jgi:ABC-type Zn uptake system ZnuABC Zn-binding protein ZnuA